MEKKNEVLSMMRFKLPNGELKAFETLNKEEQLDFILAFNMNQIIQLIEVAVPNDRVFNRTKFNVMQTFHKMLNDIKNLEAK